MRLGARVSFSVPDFEQRLSNLQAQMDRLRHSPAGDLALIEERLSLLVDQCAEIARRWAVTSERHTRAVAGFEAHLGEWADAGVRLQQDAGQRLQDLQALVQREWCELRALHEEPLRQIQEHAANLTQVCLATASAAQQNAERADVRLAAIEEAFGRHMSGLTREIQTAAAGLHAAQAPIPLEPIAVATAPLPMEPEEPGQFQQPEHSGEPQQTASVPLEAAAPAPPAIEADHPSSAAETLTPPAASPETTLPATPLVEPAAPEPRVVEAESPPSPAPVAATPAARMDTRALSTRLDKLERSLDTRDRQILEATHRTDRAIGLWRAATAVLAVLVVVSGVMVWQLRSGVAVDVAEARREARTVGDAATQTVAAARDAAVRDTRDALDRADRAQAMVNVLAAPDVIRYDLVGRDTLTGASAQLRWSRSRGLMFTASRMSAPPEQATYQLWLLTRAGTVAAATFVPDSAGTVTLTRSAPETAGPVVGAIITIEPAGGSEMPTGSTVLARPSEPERPPAPPR